MKNIVSSKLVMYLLIFIFYLMYFSIILQSGYLSDDALNCNVKGALYNNTTIYELTLSIFKSWLNGGRVFPFAFYAYGLFATITSRWIYKLCIILFITLNSFLFGSYIKRITKSDQLKLYIIMLYPTMLQLTSEFSSPIYSFHMLLQITILWLLLSLHTIISYIQTEKKIYNALSVIFLFIALGTYEISYTFILLLVITTLSLTHSLNKRIKVLLPHIIVLFIAFSFSMYFRLTTQVISYDGVAIDFDIKKILITFFKQCSGALPLTRYLVTFGKDVYPYTIKDILLGIKIYDLLMIILLFIILFYIKKNYNNKEYLLNMKYIFLLAFLFFVMPGALISLSVNYQRELSWGIGHLPTYMQNFGFTLLCSSIMYYILKINKSKIISILLKCCVLIFLVLSIILNQQIARISVFNVNNYFRWPRETVINAIDKGILSDISSEVLIGTTDYTFDKADPRYFYSLASKRQINAMSHSEYINIHQKNDDTKYVITSYAEKTFGYVILGELIDESIDNNVDSRISIINPKIFIQGDLADIDQYEILATNDINSFDYSKKVFKIKEMLLINQDKRFKLYQMNYNGKIDLKSFSFYKSEMSTSSQPIDKNANKKMYFELGKGFTAIEGEYPNQWMWLSNDSQLIIYNNTQNQMKYNINFNIFSGYMELSNLKLYINDVLFEYYVNSEGTSFNEEIVLNNGANVITFQTNAQRVVAPSDPRELYLRIMDFNMFSK